MLDQTAAIKKLWPGCKVYDSEGKITGVKMGPVSDRWVEYDTLFHLSSILGHNNFDVGIDNDDTITIWINNDR